MSTFKKSNTTTKSASKPKGNKQYINEMAEVLRGDRGNYITIKKDVTLPAGSKLYITPMVDHVNGLVERGVITESEGEKRIADFSEGGKRDFILSTITAVIEG